MNAISARIKFAQMTTRSVSIASTIVSYCTVILVLFGATTSCSAQGDTGWWKGLFKGTQKSMCDSTSAEQPEPEAPGVMIWEAPATNDPEAPAASEPAAAIEERPVGSVVEQFDERIASLDSAWHAEEHALRGFRVQIFSGSLQSAREVRAQARRTNGEWPVYLSSMPPNYRVTIGDFRTRWEAQKAQDAWTNAFPTAIVIPMDINLPVLRTGGKNEP
jgi:hypothetical protein